METPSNSLVGEFQRMAAEMLRGDRARHSIAPDDLVQSAFLRSYTGDEGDLSRADWRIRVSRAMRRELVDRGRRRDAQKRGEAPQRRQLDASWTASSTPDPLSAVAVDDALEELERLDGRLAQVVELRVFGRCTNEESAEAIGCSVRTVQSLWRKAEAWLRDRFEGDEDVR